MNTTERFEIWKKTGGYVVHQSGPYGQLKDSSGSNVIVHGAYIDFFLEELEDLVRSGYVRARQAGVYELTTVL
jgi:hypothetical protein